MNREETSDYIQSLSLEELKNWCKGGTPVNIIWTDDTPEEETDEQTAAYIQSLSIAEIKAMFANGRRVQINWAEEMPDDEDDFVQLPSKTYAMPETELSRVCEDAEPVYGTKSKQISKEKMALIAGLPYDEMYRKHELSTWTEDDEPQIFNILGKPVLLGHFLEDDSFELITAALSPDEQYLFVLLRDLNSQFTYTANAKLHEATGVYVTMVYHSNYIADWDKCTTTFEEKISWF